MERARSHVRLLRWEALPQNVEGPHSTSHRAKSCRSGWILRHEPLRKGSIFMFLSIDIYTPPYPEVLKIKL